MCIYHKRKMWLLKYSRFSTDHMTTCVAERKFETLKENYLQKYNTNCKSSMNYFGKCNWKPKTNQRG